MTVEEKAFHDKIDRVELEELMYDEFYELIAEAKNIGYKKAMRWRDPQVELPVNNIQVFVKFYSNLEDAYIYTTDQVILYNTGHRRFLRHGENVIGWRPIE